ncbi:hypothetical protein VPH13_06335 [Stenotrophomonas pavanii]|uniref:hypothetical protein n=1 Tax=Stenotrophomonas pavanii TaxID=487698 RepID=UPI002DB718AD|nr:hypothetical protein [Stenotrophomonas pavanii]MEC4338332.1 hypothetical protein [Stenotrophomonas pavanii]
MDKPRYIVDIVIAAPGTPLLDPVTQQPLRNPDGSPQTSGPGHMFYVLRAPGKDPASYGFAPIEHGSMNGPGDIVDSDAKTYKNPHYTRSLEITEAQYNKLRAFGDDPVAHGFSKHYADVRHNCVDFTWGALNHAGIQRKHSLDVNSIGGPVGQLLPDVRIPLGIQSQGKDGYRPLRNIHGVDSIEPPFPNSELNRTTTHPLPERTLKQHLLSEVDNVDGRIGERLAADARTPGHSLHALDQKVRTALDQASEQQGLPPGQEHERLAGHLTHAAVQAGFSEKDTLQVAFSSNSTAEAPGYVFLHRSRDTASPDPAANRQRLSLLDTQLGDADTLYQQANVKQQSRDASRLAQDEQQAQQQASPRMA